VQNRNLVLTGRVIAAAELDKELSAALSCLHIYARFEKLETDQWHYSVKCMKTAVTLTLLALAADKSTGYSLAELGVRFAISDKVFFSFNYLS